MNYFTCKECEQVREVMREVHGPLSVVVVLDCGHLLGLSHAEWRYLTTEYVDDETG